MPAQWTRHRIHWSIGLLTMMGLTVIAVVAGLGTPAAAQIGIGIGPAMLNFPLHEDSRPQDEQVRPRPHTATKHSASSKRQHSKETEAKSKPNPSPSEGSAPAQHFE
jgi:hypothetical protein